MMKTMTPRPLETQNIGLSNLLLSSRSSYVVNIVLWNTDLFQFLVRLCGVKMYDENNDAETAGDSEFESYGSDSDDGGSFIDESQSDNLEETNETVTTSRMGDAESNRQIKLFDTQLTSQHSYLGAELEAVRGRTLLEEGYELTLDMLQTTDLLLMPGQTLPFTAFDLPTINMLLKCVQNDRTFGVMASMTDPQTGAITLYKYGTTAEIYEYLPEEGTSGFRIKAKARQRFQLIDIDSRWRGRVKILPEVNLPDPLERVGLQCLRRFHSSPATRQRLRKFDVCVTHWPAFVYEQYDVQRLISGIKRELVNTLFQGKKDKAPTTLHIPDDPSDLSFWVAQNLPLKEEERLLLLKLNSPIQRLRFEFHALQVCRRVLCCQNCRAVIGSSTDIFSMSSDGPQGTYVNPGGYLHETITLHKVKNLFSDGIPSTEFSWYPGYSWSIIKCMHCIRHMGWKFIATTRELKPSKFWGICRKSIAIMMSNDPDEESEQQHVF